jgi:protein-S-isoprenylcysteine O-methyltransferase Ste14
MFKKLGNFFFRFRSYTPFPLIIVMLVFMDPTIMSIVSGFLIACAGEAIRLWAVSYAGSETRTTSAVGGSRLVTQGPYSIVRNPLYIGNILIYTGMGVMSNALFPWLQIAGIFYFAFQYYCIILNEEDYLRQTFKDDFVKYTSSVNRFLPIKASIPPEICSGLSFNLNAGFRSEKRSLQAFITTVVVILLFYISRVTGIISF